jgi:hypothetical protein
MLFLKEILARQTLKLDCIKNPKYPYRQLQTCHIDEQN